MTEKIDAVVMGFIVSNIIFWSALGVASFYHLFKRF